MHCKYLIIGNSVGGVAASEAIREIDKVGKIVMVSEEPHRVYSRALIPYFIAGRIDLEKMYYRDANFYEKNDILPFLGKKVIKIDFKDRKAEMEDGCKIGYKKLLLATGAAPFIPQMKGLDKERPKDGFFTFSSLDDAMKIKKKIESGIAERAAVLGGGLTGLMAAEALAENGIEVTVVELAGSLLPGVLDETASHLVEEHLEEKSLKISTGRRIVEVVGEESVETAVLDDGTILPCDLLIIGAGVRPRVELARDTGVRVNRGIVVDRRMRTSVNDVYACGDCAEDYDFLQGDFRLLPIWPTAYAGGRVAGFNMCGVEREYRWGTNMNSMHFFGLRIIVAGSITENGDDEVFKKICGDGNYRRIALKDDRVVGMILMNEIEGAGVLLNLMRAGINVKSFKEELLSNDFGLISLPEKLRQEIMT